MMPNSKGNWERLQEEIEQARQDAYNQFIESLRNSRGGNLYPQGFHNRTAPYQRSWLESQIELREAEISRTQGTSGQSTFIGSALSAVKLSLLHDQLTEFKAQLAELSTPPPPPPQSPPPPPPSKAEQLASIERQIADLEVQCAKWIAAEITEEAKRRRGIECRETIDDLKRQRLKIWRLL